VIKLKRLRWAGHVTRLGERRGLYRVFVGKPERDHLGEPGVDGRVIIRWMFRDGGAWTGWIWIRIETGDGCL